MRYKYQYIFIFSICIVSMHTLYGAASSQKSVVRPEDPIQLLRRKFECFCKAEQKSGSPIVAEIVKKVDEIVKNPGMNFADRINARMIEVEVYARGGMGKLCPRKFVSCYTTILTDLKRMYCFRSIASAERSDIALCMGTIYYRIGITFQRSDTITYAGYIRKMSEEALCYVNEVIEGKLLPLDKMEIAFKCRDNIYVQMMNVPVVN